MVIESDPAARRLALVRWSAREARWSLVIAVRAVAGLHVRERLEARARVDRLSTFQILDVTGRKGSVDAAIAALPPPSGGGVQAELDL